MISKLYRYYCSYSYLVVVHHARTTWWYYSSVSKVSSRIWYTVRVGVIYPVTLVLGIRHPHHRNNPICTPSYQYKNVSHHPLSNQDHDWHHSPTPFTLFVNNDFGDKKWDRQRPRWVEGRYRDTPIITETHHGFWISTTTSSSSSSIIVLIRNRWRGRGHSIVFIPGTIQQPSIGTC